MRRCSISGVLVATTLVLLGGLAAGVAWWYNLARTWHALDFWGPQAVALIRDAPQVAAWRISFDRGREVAGEDAGGLRHPVSGTPADVREMRDISRAKGLVHLRHALLDDRSFTWSDAPVEMGGLHYALTFQQDQSRLVVYFSEDFSLLADCFQPLAGPAAGPAKIVSTRPIAPGLREYFSDIFADEQAETSRCR